MHRVLLLDEVLRQIFELCPNYCLPVAARTCRSWKEPAVDILWSHLRSLAPLLELIPRLVCVDGVYNVESADHPLTANFYSYARRVRNIVQRHNLRIHPNLLSLISSEALSGLVSTRLSSLDSGYLATALSFTPALRQLDIDFGFKRPACAPPDHDLKNLRRVAHQLERVRLRGFADARLNLCISQMSQLHSLILRTGPFITPETLIALSVFPRLSELDIDATHLDADTFTPTWPTDEPFHSLQHLRISASEHILRLFMTCTLSSCLRTLRLEANGFVDWKSIVSSIGDNTSQTLQELTLDEHFTDREDIPIDSDTPTPKAGPNRDRITVDTLRVLSRFGRLQKFVLDTTYLPDVTDSDIIELIALKCWPHLVHLDLGTVDSFECLPPACVPRTTPDCLRAFAQGIPGLQTLALALDFGLIPGGQDTTSISNSSLTRIIVSSPTPPPTVADTAHHLRSLFPSLREVEGTNEQHADIWKAVESQLRD
ncbi:hypothetical protein C8F01DRAFT_1019901 [Mycena amicta]|nr:hypothetical protein C8F01DRAFT_1019901 [Mycena amicta]